MSTTTTNIPATTVGTKNKAKVICVKCGHRFFKNEMTGNVTCPNCGSNSVRGLNESNEKGNKLTSDSLIDRIINGESVDSVLTKC